jgi:hypothetical protein
MTQMAVALGPFFAWLQTTRIATTVAESLPLTAGLSSIHLIGFTLLMGGAVVSNLRLLGVLLPERPVLEVAGPAGRGIALGLVISVATGLPLFAARASVAIENGVFQLKMLLLVTAVVFHFAHHRRVVRRDPATPSLLRVTGALGLMLWFGVALAGCAFILLE